MIRPRPVIGAGILVLVVGLITGLYIVKTRRADEELRTGTTPGASKAAATAPGPTATTAAPVNPPIRVCNNASLLDGPSKPPAGAVVVSTSQNLETLTNNSPAGTTFWLATGIHKLGTGEFDQVMPKAGNTYLGAPGAILDGQRKNLYAFTGTAAGVTLKNLTIRNFGPRGSNNDEGVVNHESSERWTLEGNTIRDNSGSGVMIGKGGILKHNCLADNGQSGFGTYHPGGVANVLVDGNEITGNNTDDWEHRRPGCGCTGGGKFWEVTRAVVRNNWVHNNKGAGLWADTNNVGFLFERNYISDNDAEGLIYETSYNAVIRGNTFVGNGHVEGPSNGNFPTPAIYISESGSDERLHAGSSKTLDISDNVLRDNWAGVVLWENANRFSGSPSESNDTSTLVNPGQVTAETCIAANIAKKPYFDDCRWKTQNVQVHNNVFSLDPSRLPSTCSAKNGCGYNGLFTNWGTFPTWSPYKGKTVQDAVVLQQNNHFFANVYSGPWSFIVPAQGVRANWATWQGAPYGQDADSVIMLLPSPSPSKAR